jgi:uncharacterized protein (TIGR00369 family)
MKLAFEANTETGHVTGRFKIGSEFQGSYGVLHGGIISALLDEAMGKVCRLSDVRAVTAELNVEFLKPIYVDQEIVVESYQTKREGRQMYHHGEIRDVSGRVLARGRGRFVIIDPANYAKEPAKK